MDGNYIISRLQDMVDDPNSVGRFNAAQRAKEAIDYIKQLNAGLIMQTALAQNGKIAIESNKQLAMKFEALLKDFKEFILDSADICRYCKYHQPCRGKECECYVEGKGARDQYGYTHDWQWSCQDFNYGTCSKLENTPCNGCIKNNMQGFEWRGV